MNQETINKSQWSDEQIRAAKQVWEDYDNAHDLSDRKGQAAGIDPETGDVWLGDDIVDIVNNRRDEGLSSSLFFVRIGYPTYYRKGGRR